MVDYRTRGDTATVLLSGELDHSAAAAVKRSLDEIIADRKITTLVLDLKNLTFMDSAGLGVIMGRYRQLAGRSGQMAVKNVSSSIDRIFTISGIYSIVRKL